MSLIIVIDRLAAAAVVVQNCRLVGCSRRVAVVIGAALAQDSVAAGKSYPAGCVLLISLLLLTFGYFLFRLSFPFLLLL